MISAVTAMVIALVFDASMSGSVAPAIDDRATRLPKLARPTRRTSEPEAPRFCRRCGGLTATSAPPNGCSCGKPVEEHQTTATDERGNHHG